MQHSESRMLTYFIATRNKLPYLTETLQELLRHRKSDEEIIVVDGASTDGTVEYLTKLHAEGVIDAFISEPDYGEAHADNKAMLMARGTLLKVITDDDAFHYPSIERCKQYMLEHPMIDVLSTDGVKARLDTSHPFTRMSYTDRFTKRHTHRAPFASCGLGLMMRRSSLPALGLFDTSFARVDAEYTLRITASKVRMAWYPCASYAHIRNVHSVSATQERRITDELERLETLYFGVRLIPTLKQTLRSLLSRTTRAHTQTVSPHPETLFEEWRQLFRASHEWLEHNAEHTPTTPFLESDFTQKN